MANPPINGTDGPETLSGNDGDDTINALGGDDQLFGLGGHDVLNGGSGNDILVGGAGQDTLTGGTWSDIFRDTAANFNGDEITDFLPVDRIQLTDLSLSSDLTLIGSSLTYDLPGGGQGSITIDNVG